MIYQSENSQETICWSTDGQSFIIGNVQKFIPILEKFFKTNNYSSFVRQLNMYNFQKINNAQNLTEFHHKNFRKDAIENLKFIYRKLTKNLDSGKKKSKDKKSLLLENNYLKQKIAQLEHTYTVICAQTKMMIDISKDLINKISDSKTENDSKIRKLMFLYFALINQYGPKLWSRIESHVLQILGIQSQFYVLEFKSRNIFPLGNFLDQQISDSPENIDPFLSNLVHLFLKYHNDSQPIIDNKISFNDLLITFNLNSSFSTLDHSSCFLNPIILSQASKLFNQNTEDHECESNLWANSIFEDNSVLDYDIGSFRLTDHLDISKDQSIQNSKEEKFFVDFQN